MMSFFMCCGRQWTFLLLAVAVMVISETGAAPAGCSTDICDRTDDIESASSDSVACSAVDVWKHCLEALKQFDACKEPLKDAEAKLETSAKKFNCETETGAAPASDDCPNLITACSKQDAIDEATDEAAKCVAVGDWRSCLEELKAPHQCNISNSDFPLELNTAESDNGCNEPDDGQSDTDPESPDGTNVTGSDTDPESPDGTNVTGSGTASGSPDGTNVTGPDDGQTDDGQTGTASGSPEGTNGTGPDGGQSDTDPESPDGTNVTGSGTDPDSTGGTDGTGLDDGQSGTGPESPEGTGSTGSGTPTCEQQIKACRPADIDSTDVAIKCTSSFEWRGCLERLMASPCNLDSGDFPYELADVQAKNGCNS